MSSHILSEVDRLATRIGIIHQGCLIEELDAEKVEHLRARRLVVQARDRKAAKATLEKAGYVVTFSNSIDPLVLTDSRAVENPDQVATLLVHAGTPPTRLAVEQEELEDHFLRLTGSTV